MVGLIYALPLTVNAIFFVHHRSKLFSSLISVYGIYVYIDLLFATVTALIMIVFYGRMCYLLHVHNKHVKNIQNEDENANVSYLIARQKRNRKTVVTSVVVTAFFLVSQFQFILRFLLIVLESKAKWVYSDHVWWLSRILYCLLRVMYNQSIYLRVF